MQRIVLTLFLAAAAAPSAAARQCPPALTLEAKLVPTGADEFDRVGTSVAIDGDLIVAGAPGDDHAGEFSGRAYVFARVGGEWTLSGRLQHPTPRPGDEFGSAVAVDGGTVVVGAYGDAVLGTPRAGSAHVHVREGGTWVRQAELYASDYGFADRFSRGLAIRGDRIAVGAALWDGAAFNQGAVYVFERSGGVWTETAIVHVPNGEPGDRFGMSVLLLDDVLVVGAPYVSHPSGEEGSVYVFTLQGGAWTQTSAFWRADAMYLQHFGWALAARGDELVVGGPTANGSGPGRAWVYEYNGTGWAPTDVLSPTDGTGGDWFGVSLAFASGLIAVGAFQHEHEPNSPGAFYLASETEGAWNVEAELRPEGLGQFDAFGAALAASDDRLVAGWAGDDDAGFDAGAVLVYRQAYEGYCFGDGSGAPCPCGNVSDLGAGQGCANSSGSGARLCGLSSPSVSDDDFVMSATGLLPGQAALAFAGPSLAGGGAGLPFGDGLLCVGGSVQRLGIRVPDGAGRASWGPGLAAQLGLAPGDLRRFQAWYRDPSGPCGAGFNLTNGTEVVLTP